MYTNKPISPIVIVILISLHNILQTEQKSIRLSNHQIIKSSNHHRMESPNHRMSKKSLSEIFSKDWLTNINRRMINAASKKALFSHINFGQNKKSSGFSQRWSNRSKTASLSSLRNLDKIFIKFSNVEQNVTSNAAGSLVARFDTTGSRFWRNQNRNKP
jgi:hypothetical protein